MVEIAQHKTITKAQIKSIHVALSRHGIDDDTYRAKLDAMFGVSSCKQLSRREASTLLRSLGCKLQNRPGHFPQTKGESIATATADKPITKAQIKSIHIALSRHRIDDATYLAKLDLMFSVSSCQQLSRRDASVLLKSLEHKLGSHLQNIVKFGQSAPKQLPAGVVSLPSPAQRRFIGDLVGEIVWRVANGYQHWLQKNMGLNRVATTEQARRVIEGLKALKTHQADE